MSFIGGGATGGGTARPGAARAARGAGRAARPDRRHVRALSRAAALGRTLRRRATPNRRASASRKTASCAGSCRTPSRTPAASSSPRPTTTRPTPTNGWPPATRATSRPKKSRSPRCSQEEPALNPAITRAFRVPDASCDSFDVLTALGAAIQAHGGTVLTYHEVVGLTVAGGKVAGATVRNVRTGEERRLAAALVVNAAGAWAGQIAAMAGCPVTVRPSKGTMVAMAYRFVNTIINRCHPPGDGDILVPVGTVAVIGTTSVNVPDPNDTSVQAWEVRKHAGRGREDGARLQPGARAARLGGRAAAVRGRRRAPRAARPSAPSPCSITPQRDGVAGLVTVVGGKFTTYRLMAERAADVVCAQLGVTSPARPRTSCLPDVRVPLTGAQAALAGASPGRCRDAKQPDPLICECELVTRSDFEQAPAQHPDVAAPWVLDDLRRDLRLGMGPCQGGFCGYRAAGILHEMGHQDAAAGHRRPGGLRAATLEGPAPAAVGPEPAPGAAGRAHLPRISWGWIGWSSKPWMMFWSSAPGRPGCLAAWLARQTRRQGARPGEPASARRTSCRVGSACWTLMATMAHPWRAGSPSTRSIRTRWRARRTAGGLARCGRSARGLG